MLKKIAVSLITTFIILVLVISTTSWTKIAYVASAAQLKKEANQPPLASSLTMLEAWDVFATYGKEENRQFSIALIQSIDVPGDTQQAGYDGRRRGWIGVLLTQNSTLRLTIVDGKIVDQSTESLSVNLSILDRPAIDSPEALAMARLAKPQLEGSTNQKGQGFHFVLASDASGKSRISTLGMVRGQTARVQIDSENGTLLSAQIYTFAPVGGILYSADGGKSWQASTLNDKMVMSISPDPVQINSGYAVTAESQGICVYQTQDGGASWKLLSSLPPDAGNWPFDLLVMQIPSGELLFSIGTWNGLWFSLDGVSWMQAPGLSGPVQWLASITSDGKYRILATVSSGEQRGLYSTTTLWEWTHISDTIYRLSESFDRQMVIAVSEEQPQNGLLFDVMNNQKALLPDGVLYLAGDFRGEFPIISYSPFSGVGVSEELGNNVTWSLPVPVASLAAAPDFSKSQIALAGGFRTGLYRTQDGGRHWEQVLQKPSDILPGSDEIYAVSFLSSTAVIAIQGGRLAWQGF
jgi:hypothetical protein